MFTPSFFQTFSFPWILFSDKGREIASGDGTLFKGSENLTSQRLTDFYKFSSNGWSKCPLGYAVLSRRIASLSNSKLVIYGLKVSGVSTITGKSESLSIKLTKEQVEKYLNSMLLGFNFVAEDLRNLIARSVHEVRGINKEVKSATDDVLFILERNKEDMSDAKDRIKNIAALSEILSSRTDFLDYFANPALARQSSPRIYLHQKFYKVTQSLTSRAKAKGINIYLTGTSIGCISGLRVFEVVPFILIENAIKYSPFNSHVNIVFLETMTSIKITITNIGPYIDPSDLKRVFDFGFRGPNAIATGTAGYGIGLNFVKELVEVDHKGKIQFEQAQETELIKKIPYTSTSITLEFPRSA